MSIQPQDIAILDLIARRRFATSKQIMLALGYSSNSISARLKPLMAQRYISREDQPRAGFKGGRAAYIYRVESRGIKALRPLESVSPKRFQCLQYHAKNESRAHALMITDFLAKAEASARNHPSRTFIDPYEIKRELFPSPKQIVWSARAQFKNKSVILTSIPDETFGLLDDDLQSSEYFFFEADRGTMPINPKTSERSSLAKKIAAYHATFEQGLHTQYFGFPSFRVIFLVPTRARLGSVVDLCTQFKRGKGIFLLVDEKTYQSYDSIFDIPFVSGSGKTRFIQ